MEVQKVYIGKKDRAPVRCPVCGIVKDVSTSAIRNIFRPVRVKCVCGESFLASFEKRAYYRKDVHIVGYYWSREDDDNEYFEIIIENVSLTGIGFRTLEEHSLEVGDIISLKFVLDNQRKASVKCNAIVRRTVDQYIGAELFGLEEDTKKHLGFYLLP